MRVAIYNSFFGQDYAEKELALRICLAGEKLDWEMLETGSSNQIRNFNPDFVLALHFSSPKITGFPTYGCMWNPPTFFKEYDKSIDKIGHSLRNILSYDAYLSSSKLMDQWINKTLTNKDKKHFIAPFYTSCNQTYYCPPKIDNPLLMYIGTNWDGCRFKELFKKLDSYEFMAIYGIHSGWKYLKQSYKGTLPFDGTSVLRSLNEAGIGLCLHKEKHCEFSIPSMRIFETVASGALAICGDHPFIRENFGDCVLYLNSNLNDIQKGEQIYEYVDWIRTNKNKALEMSRAAHEIFCKNFSLETLLQNLIPFHEKLIEQKGFILPSINTQYSIENQVQFIVRVGGRSSTTIKRALDSIANQSYKNIAVILIQYNDIPDLDNILDSYQGRISIKVIRSCQTGYRSTQLFDGINALSSKYFAILDDDDVIHPNHVSLLVSILENNAQVDVAYSGSICVLELVGNKCPEDTFESSSLAFFEPFDILKIANFNNFITSNSYVAKTSSIRDAFCKDPELVVSEDFFLILSLCEKSVFKFSFEATCEFYWRKDNSDNATFDGGEAYISPVWLNAGKRLLDLFWDKEFLYKTTSLSGKTIYKSKKLREMRYLKNKQIIVPLTEKQFQLPFPIFNFFKSVYLMFTGGGVSNSSPSFFAKIIIKLKYFIFR
jgi:glycosyltransferase involved in cell wall biosynthesis